MMTATISCQSQFLDLLLPKHIVNQQQYGSGLVAYRLASCSSLISTAKSAVLTVHSDRLNLQALTPPRLIWRLH